MAPLLSVLDLSLVTSGTPPSKALRNSIDLARHVDRLGYMRYWLAEHQGMGVAGLLFAIVWASVVSALILLLRWGALAASKKLPAHAPEAALH